MTNDTLTIDKAIDKVLEKYPSFKTSGTETPGFKIGGSGDKEKNISVRAYGRAAWPQ